MSAQDPFTCQVCGRPHGTGVECNSTRDSLIGTIIDDKYELVRLLGQGGMGSVYEARHKALERRFAVKFLLPEFAANQEVLRRFGNEAKAAGRLEHPNVGAVTDLGRAPDGSPFIVMEFLSGMDCARLLKKNGPLPVSRAANIVYQTCLGLAAAHAAGIIHRDIKPENMFVTDAGDGSDLVKVLDFGIAKLRLPDASAVTGSGASMGTFYYMSPEQIRDASKVDLRTDIWALGVVLHELLTGKKPFEGSDALQVIYRIANETPEPIERVRRGVPAPVVKIVERAMNKSYEERFPSASALAEALYPFSGRQSIRPVQQVDPFDLTEPGPISEQRSTTSHAGVATISKIVGAGRPRVHPRNSRTPLWLGGGVVIAVAIGVVGSSFSKVPRAISAQPKVSSVETSNSAAANAVPASSPVVPAGLAHDLGAGGVPVRTMFEHARPNAVLKPFVGQREGTQRPNRSPQTQTAPLPSVLAPTSEHPRLIESRPNSSIPTVSIDKQNPFSAH